MLNIINKMLPYRLTGCDAFHL